MSFIIVNNLFRLYTGLKVTCYCQIRTLLMSCFFKEFSLQSLFTLICLIIFINLSLNLLQFHLSSYYHGCFGRDFSLELAEQFFIDLQVFLDILMEFFYFTCNCFKITGYSLINISIFQLFSRAKRLFIEILKVFFMFFGNIQLCLVYCIVCNIFHFLFQLTCTMLSQQR